VLARALWDAHIQNRTINSWPVTKVIFHGLYCFNTRNYVDFGLREYNNLNIVRFRSSWV